jgi:hypothetical protein
MTPKKWFKNISLKVRKAQRKNCKIKQGHLRSTEVSYINVEEVEQKITRKITMFTDNRVHAADNENGNGLKRIRSCIRESYMVININSQQGKKLYPLLASRIRVGKEISKKKISLKCFESLRYTVLTL